MNKTLGDMKTTLDERVKEKLALEEERDYLKETVGNLQGQLNQIQAEVKLCSCLSPLVFFSNNIRCLQTEIEYAVIMPPSQGGSMTHCLSAPCLTQDENGTA